MPPKAGGKEAVNAGNSAIAVAAVSALQAAERVPSRRQVGRKTRAPDLLTGFRPSGSRSAGGGGVFDRIPVVARRANPARGGCCAQDLRPDSKARCLAASSIASLMLQTCRQGRGARNCLGGGGSLFTPPTGRRSGQSAATSSNLMNLQLSIFARLTRQTARRSSYTSAAKFSGRRQCSIFDALLLLTVCGAAAR